MARLNQRRFMSVVVATMAVATTVFSSSSCRGFGSAFVPSSLQGRAPTPRAVVSSWRGLLPLTVGRRKTRSIISWSTMSSFLSSLSEGDVDEKRNIPDVDSLIDMDVVVYSFDDDEQDTKRFAALQEDGVLSPLSAWTTEPAFGDSIEFLVDEEDRFSLVDKMERIKLHHLIDESNLSYGSRQCHRGVGNPHGEESELLYYIDQSLIDKFDAKVNIKPELEILW